MEFQQKVIVVLHDLLFQVRILEAAKRAGVTIAFLKTEEDVLSQAENRPALIILDLNDAAAKPLDLIEKLKSGAQTKNVRLLGYVSHVQADVIRAAREKGCDEVLARSAFIQNLQDILSPYGKAM